MALTKGKQLRYNDQELSLIKNTFADNEELLALFRKYLLDGELSEEEKGLLNTLTGNEATLNLLEKAVKPNLDRLAPPFQVVDLYSNLDFQPTPKDHAVDILKGRHLAVQYLTQRFDALRGKTVEFIKFDSLVEPTEDNTQTFVNILARNFLLSHIDTQLFGQLMVIAGAKEESLDQQKKRLTQNSNK